ncbi:aldo/keto reductase [Pelagibacterium xiamenense]|uniref:aldo/keto reductase n=1 Tax=Pelagibacterium xiamenense TaxID=2901140 RepID=UPI001E2B2383|nr:aldo/keto reductase [Pelagibacterium xiamenense]MCD7060234.1 aldo/keto reductase [Pelagibacterium xiamenense]
MTQQPLIELNDGNTIPQIGLGVWRTEDADTPRVIAEAIAAGYRHIDTAQAYGNEEGVGRAVREAAVPREELFITTKERTSHQGYDSTMRSFDESMGRLGLDYLDLFLIHWPVPMHDRYVDTWKAFVELQKQGRVRSIGVSNFLPEHIERLAAETGVLPAVNQLELHPYYQQRDVRDFHTRHNVAIQSYSPLGSGAVLADAEIGAIAAAHGKSIAQVIIRWHVQQGLIVLPKSVTPSRIRENIAVFDFELSSEEMARIGALDSADGKTLPEPAEMSNLF